MSEKEKKFLEERTPLYLIGDNMNITLVTGKDKDDIHSHLCKQYGINWMRTIRGYWIPNKLVCIYIGDYEIPNISIEIIQYIFNFFKDINYLGIGCNKGEVGEIWEPKICIARDVSFLKDDIRSI